MANNNKNYKIKAEAIRQLIPPMGGCIATDKITVDGLPIRYMYREKPSNELDSGWRFFSGTETQQYIDDLGKSGVYDVNTLANYDASIIPYLDLPFGIELEKDDNSNRFNLVSG